MQAKRFVAESLFEQMRFASLRANDAFAEHRLEPSDRYRDALRIEVVRGEERLSFSSFFELERLQSQPDDCGVERHRIELCAKHVEHRALMRRRNCERHVEIARAG